MKDEETKLQDLLTRYDLRISLVTVNKGGSISYDGDVDFAGRGLKKLPIKFKEVRGDFDCSYNRLRTLENSPEKVEGYFDCSDNELRTLKHAPKIVKGTFDCAGNALKTLEGSPKKAGDFYCYDNESKFTQKDVRAVTKVDGWIYTSILKPNE